MSDEIQIDAETSQRIEGEMASMAESLRSERTKLDTRVQQLLDGGWTGVAATQYGTGWDGWVTGADDVLAALAALSRLIGEARIELTGTDRSIADIHALLEQRLGPA